MAYNGYLLAYIVLFSLKYSTKIAIYIIIYDASIRGWEGLLRILDGVLRVLRILIGFYGGVLRILTGREP